MEAVRRIFDGYDMGVLYADQHIRQLLNALADVNVLEETAIIISADHGENLGELNVYCDHQTADHITSRVPLIVKWPGLHAGAERSAAPASSSSSSSSSPASPRTNRALHYHFDFAATRSEEHTSELQ